MKCAINYSNDVFSDQSVQAVSSTAQGGTASTTSQGTLQYVYVPNSNTDNYKFLLIILVIIVFGLLFAIPRGDEA